MDRKKIHIIIVAAGSGSRFGGPLPKQFCALADDGTPVLGVTVARLRALLPQAAVTLVLSPEAMPLWSELCSLHSIDSPAVVAGGATRARSVANAMSLVADDTDIVMVHDGARPVVTDTLIDGLLQALEAGSHGAVPAVAVTDSLRRVDPTVAGGNVAVDRSLYRAVQTPQAFDAALLRRAYARADIDAFTDDASLAEAIEPGCVTLTDGDPRNIKITRPGDIDIARRYLDMP